LRELFLTFDSYETANSFHCDYVINVNNLPHALKGKLHFVIEKDATDLTPETSERTGDA
jgi:hypothetical protein